MFAAVHEFGNGTKRHGLRAAECPFCAISDQSALQRKIRVSIVEIWSGTIKLAGGFAEAVCLHGAAPSR